MQGTVALVSTDVDASRTAFVKYQSSTECPEPPTADELIAMLQGDETGAGASEGSLFFSEYREGRADIAHYLEIYNPTDQ